jgi:methylenetetrahydrofolate dehydrogenase (NADP+)/methenyltetrahydrofolate cyclohydrolase
MIWDESGSLPCTPAGIMHLLNSQNIELRGKEVVIIGRSNIVWKPLTLLLINAWATVISCNSSTKDITKFTAKADIVIAAAWSPHLISSANITKDCVVIDVWFNFIDGTIIWDCEFTEIHEQGNLITPVPWWVWPMTVAMLMENTLSCHINNS